MSSLGTPQIASTDMIDIGSTHRPSLIGHSINLQSIYQSLVRMNPEFAFRVPLTESQLIARQLRSALSLPITRSVRRILVLDDSISLYFYPSGTKN